MNAERRSFNCAVYTRKSHEEGLEQEFNSLDAQYEAGKSYVMSQRSRGWRLIAERYDDGGFSGGTMERPAFKRLLADVYEGKIDVIVVYKIDRFSRSLLDFTKLYADLQERGVGVVSVTQQFDTSSATGRLFINII